jgi:hypothetical protein
MTVLMYTLRLQSNRPNDTGQPYFFVGTTSRIDVAVERHLNGDGGDWTRLHPPLRPLVYETVSLGSIATSHYCTHKADATVVKLMKVHGLGAVRGGSYSDVELTADQTEYLALAVTAESDDDDETGDIGDSTDSDSDSEDEDYTVSTDDGDSTGEDDDTEHCVRCGRNTHSLIDCHAMRHTNGERFPCGRCGRDLHTESGCTETTNRDGEAILVSYSM